jgi:hypothetical protein
MSDTLSFVEINSQDVELLPARTVMSTFAMGGEGKGAPGVGGDAATTQNTLINLLGIISGGSKGGAGLGGN